MSKKMNFDGEVPIISAVSAEQKEYQDKTREQIKRLADRVGYEPEPLDSKRPMVLAIRLGKDEELWDLFEIIARATEYIENILAGFREALGEDNEAQ